MFLSSTSEAYLSRSETIVYHGRLRCRHRLPSRRNALCPRARQSRPPKKTSSDRLFYFQLRYFPTIYGAPRSQWAWGPFIDLVHTYVAFFSFADNAKTTFAEHGHLHGLRLHPLFPHASNLTRVYVGTIGFVFLSVSSTMHA